MVGGQAGRRAVISGNNYFRDYTCNGEIVHSRSWEYSPHQANDIGAPFGEMKRGLEIKRNILPTATLSLPLSLFSPHPRYST